MPNPYQMYNSYPQVQAPTNGLISVRNEMEARNYPIAPGNSLTFKDETAPYIYTKTMGFSQLDRPTFERWRLTKEEVAVNEVFADNPNNFTLDDVKGQISEIRALYEDLRTKVETLDKPKRTVKKEVTEDE